MYFIVHAALVCIKLMMMMMIKADAMGDSSQCVSKQMTSVRRNLQTSDFIKQDSREECTQLTSVSEMLKTLTSLVSSSTTARDETPRSMNTDRTSINFAFTLTYIRTSSTQSLALTYKSHEREMWR